MEEPEKMFKNKFAAQLLRLTHTVAPVAPALKLGVAKKTLDMAKRQSDADATRRQKKGKKMSQGLKKMKKVD